MYDLIVEAFSIQANKLLCPICSAEDWEPEQPMMACGDYPGVLFCPHCELNIVFALPAVVLDKPGDAHSNWMKHCLKKFIERFKK